jgi:hypothetical protein
MSRFDWDFTVTTNIHQQYGCHRISPKKMVIERNRIGEYHGISWDIYIWLWINTY